jgi:hypothetical protein
MHVVKWAVIPSPFNHVKTNSVGRRIPGVDHQGTMPQVAKLVGSTDEPFPEEWAMSATGKVAVAVYVDRARPQHWIVRDPEGNFWIVPPVENPWDNRQPFELTEESELEPVPGHYKYMLRLPF